MTKRIGITSDHGGFALKAKIKDAFAEYEWVDLGTDSAESVDYPDFGYKLAQEIASGAVETGIAICGSGIGISMALNRYKEVRAAVCHDVTTARLTRVDNNANVLCLGARVVGDVVALDTVKAFLDTGFEAGGRHERRVKKLAEKGQ